MASVSDLLEGIVEDVRRTKLAQAQQQLQALIIDLGPEEVEKWLPEINDAISVFFKRRKTELQATLEYVLNRDSSARAGEGAEIDADCGDVLAGIERGLLDLSDSHIFQWSTHYRDWVAALVGQLLEMPGAVLDVALPSVESLIAQHSKFIFEKGFRFKVNEQRRVEEAAHATALSGMQRFADLGVEYYSGGVINEVKRVRRVALRRISSSLLVGVIRGFSCCDFGSKSGSELLVLHRMRWFHYLTFFDCQGVDALAGQIGDVSVSSVLRKLFLPLARALDKCAGMEAAASPLPQLSQYFHERRRLEVLVTASDVSRGGSSAEVFVLVDAEAPPVSDLREAQSREISLVVCALKPDVAASPYAERIQGVLVDVNELNQTPSQFEQRACAILSGQFSVMARGNADAILDHNFARIFPLNNPFQSRYFHVVRKSVRSLLRDLEGGSGVRLWCSARRSGKTTACNDLSGSLGSSDAIFQTCEVLKDTELQGRLYGRLISYLDAGKPISSTFLSDLIDEVGQSGGVGNRVVLFIDEYETLFGRLRGAVNYDQSLRYTVVFPLLDQLVEFARENMIVLVGQQPNAHYVLMDQNKLSAYVVQDSFPLFEHGRGSTTGEFVDLLSKVISERFSFTGAFTDALYEETRGHPYLTVNVVVSLVEWLIGSRVKALDVRFDQALIQRYFLEELNSSRIALNTEYQFFLEAASDAMSDGGKTSNPWLWAVYRAMRMFVVEFGAQGECKVEEFVLSFDRLNIGSAGIAALDLLRTSDDANFFRVSGGSKVRLGIPILARIAAAATPRVN
ncbi:hypothetical protein [Stenotrophomonas riyadhensis]